MPTRPPPSDILRVDQHTEDSAVVVRAVGEVDMFTVSVLAQQLALATGSVNPPGPVVADLAGVHFFASKGIATLVTTHELCQGLGVEFRVVAGHAVQHPLDVVGISRLLNTCATITEALQARA